MGRDALVGEIKTAVTRTLVIEHPARAEWQ